MTNEDVADELSEIEMDYESRIEEEWDGPAGHCLGMLVGWLAGVYSWSDAEDVAVFLVSGRPLRLVGPLQASLDMRNAAYSLAFSPWISEETIVRVPRDSTGIARRPALPSRVARRQDGAGPAFRDRPGGRGRRPSWSEWHWRGSIRKWTGVGRRN